MSATKHALLAGASGLVGERCLARLLDHADFARVTVWSRRPLASKHAKLTVDLVDFEALPPAPADCTEIFCCLGTTIRKAGTQDAFRRVDHDYPLALAERGEAAGIRQFLMVSALGANAQSSVFYSRVKGETERDIAALGIPRHLFLQPSLLLGERHEQRAGESIAIVASRLLLPFMVGPMRKYRPIDADDVAAVMVHAATHGTPSGAIESDRIAELARQLAAA
ncbi:MAG TPA: NAD(P)H-binding protein [Burkholderiales bacterium]|nr:NAD(P)H-binding protein [Burkholderiales bacterium]